MRNDESELGHCPDCHYNGFNRLADGRCQCKRCRKKFTPRQRKSRLPDNVFQEIAASFWLMVPAARSSIKLGLNRKTIQRYYLILRLRITRNREQSMREVYGDFSLDTGQFDGFFKSGHGHYPVFGVITRGGQTWVLFPGGKCNNGALREAEEKRVEPDFWVYARDLSAYEHKEIGRFSCTPVTGREEFWPFAKHRLKKYYGGFKRNFPLFIREMEFRFNHRDDADAVAHLRKLLPHGPK